MYKLLCIVIMSLLVATATAQNKRNTPNIIFIFADDLGYGDIGCYGQQKIATPGIDALAANGIKFTQFYAGATVCAPSRASLLTGLHTGHTAVRGNISYPPEGQTPLPESSVTFAQQLQQKGYATAAFGKWGLGYITTSGDPNKKGFDYFYGYNCQSQAHDYYPDHLWNNHEKIDLSVNLQSDSIYSAALIQSQALNYIKKQNSQQPFFIYLPYTLPHGDVIVPHDSLYEHYKNKFNEAPLTGKALRTRAHNMQAEPYPHAAFAAMVSRLDEYVGQVVSAIKQKGLADNTLIIFSSDNGPHRENGGDPDFFNSNGNYRGIKRDLYEGGIRVPFIAYWPGIIKPAVTNKPAALWDVYPTILQLAGAAPAKNIDGISLLPLLLNKGNQASHNYLYWEFHENDGRQAIRWKRWKGIKLEVGKNAAAPMELYNLDTDPGEKNNIAAQQPAVVQQLEKLMQQAHQPNANWPLLANEVKKK
jgi:arylsulfatase A